MGLVISSVSGLASMSPFNGKTSWKIEKPLIVDSDSLGRLESALLAFSKLQSNGCLNGDGGNSRNEKRGQAQL